MSIKQTKLLILGSTGDGKSTLGNFILKKNVFKESNEPKSETKQTIGFYGEGDRQDVFVIDTPGLQDSEGMERKYMNQMVDYIKEQKGLQAIVIVLNFNQDRFAQNIKTMIKIIWNVFPVPDFWKHVCIVWSNCCCCFPKEVLEEMKKPKVEKYQQEFVNFVMEITGKTENIHFPMYFVDSKGTSGFDNTNSENEIVRMLTWIRLLTPIDVEEVQKSDPVYQSISEEKEVQERVFKQEKNIQTIEITYLKRDKRVTYTGDVSYTNWVVEKTENKQVVLPKKPIGTRKETKTEMQEIGRTQNFVYYKGSRRRYIICGPRPTKKQLANTTLHKQEETFEREITMYNDGTSSEGPWTTISTKKYDEVV
ncbi:AIG1 family/50S ribosome-binding GTPase, putative [Entamoeba histolytica]